MEVSSKIQLDGLQWKIPLKSMMTGGSHVLGPWYPLEHHHFSWEMMTKTRVYHDVTTIWRFPKSQGYPGTPS